MPKKVDHDARRAQIADALLRVAAERGLEAVSLRHVATAAGATAGLVQHYFRTKDEMMAFALEVVAERTARRLTAVAEGLGEHPSPRVLLRTMLAELLPLDEQRRADGRVALAFLAYAAVRPAAAAALREDSARMREFVADQIRAAQATGDAPPGTDPDAAAIALLATVDGLGIYLLGEHYAADAALAALDTQLSLIFGATAAPHSR